MNLSEAADLLRVVLRRPIAYHRAFAEIAGKASAGVMLSQAWYWTPKTNDGWFYKTRKEWQEETGMTRTEQETARRRLVKVGLFEEKLAGMPGKMHYRVNTERLISLLVENPPTGRRKTRNAVSGKPTNMTVENPPTITESTPESTSQTTNRESRASQARAVFDYWKEILNHPKAVLDNKREKAILARLRDFSVDDLLLAVKGCALSPYHMGQNDRQEVYDDISLICRDVKHVEQFIAKAEVGSNGNGAHQHEPRTASERNVRNIQESLNWINGVSGRSGADHS